MVTLPHPGHPPFPTPAGGPFLAPHPPGNPSQPPRFLLPPPPPPPWAEQFPAASCPIGRGAAGHPQGTEPIGGGTEAIPGVGRKRKGPFPPAQPPPDPPGCVRMGGVTTGTELFLGGGGVGSDGFAPPQSCPGCRDPLVGHPKTSRGCPLWGLLWLCSPIGLMEAQTDVPPPTPAPCPPLVTPSPQCPPCAHTTRVTPPVGDAPQP